MKKNILCLLVASMLSASVASAAAYFTNTSGDGLWNTPANWSGSAVPVAADYSYISSNSAVTIGGGVAAVSTTVSVGAFNASTLMGTSSLTIDGGSLYSSGAIYLAATGATSTEALNSTISLVNGASLSTAIFSIGRGVASAPTNVNYVGWFTIDKTSSASVTTQLELGRRYGTGHLTLEGDATSGAILTVAYLNAAVTSTDGSGIAYITLGTNSRLTAASSSLGVNTTVVNNGGTLQLATITSGTTTMSTGSITATGGTVSMANSFVATNSSVTLTNSTLSVGVDLKNYGTDLTLQNSTVAVGGLIYNYGYSANSALIVINASSLSAATWESANSNTLTTISNSTISLQSSVSTTWISTASTNAHTTMSNTTLIIGQNGKFDGGRLSMSGSILSMSNGAQLLAGTTFSFLTSSGNINASSVTVGNLVGWFNLGAGSQLDLTNASSLLVTGNTGTSVSGGMSVGTVSILGTMNVTGGSTLSMYYNTATTSTVSFLIGGSGLLNMDASTVTAATTLSLTSTTAGVTLTNSLLSFSALSSSGTINASGSTISLTGNLNINSTYSTLSVANSVVSASALAAVGSINVTSNSAITIIGNADLTSSASLNITNSNLAVGGTLSQNTSGVLNLTGSTLSVGSLLQSNSGNNYWTNSTVSAASWGARFSSAKTTLSNTIVTLSSSAAQAITSYTDSTAFAYLTNGSRLNIGTNGNMYIGRLSILDNSTLSMTDGNVVLTATLTISGGYASITGGTIAMDSTNRTTAIQLSNGTLSVSGTGVITGALVTNISSNATFSGALYVGTLPGTLPTSYVSTQTLSVQSGAKFLGSVNVAADGNVSLNLTGAASSLAAVTAQSLTFDSSSIVTIDFADLTLSGDAQLTLLLADTVSGLNLTNIVTKNLDSAYTVVYSTETIGVQQALIATLTTIPEPAIAAVLMGFLGLIAVVRRRR